MKILIKQIDELKGTTQPQLGKVIPEYLVYLTDNNGTPLSAEICYGNVAKINYVRDLLLKHFAPNDWENNKEKFIGELSDIVEEISYDEYLSHK